MKHKHFWLIPIYTAPVLLTYIAGTYLAVGDALRAVPLLLVAAVALAAVYFRGLYLEERNDELEPLAPTPLWGKRLSRWARDTLPETKPPPKLVEWPRDVVRMTPANDADEVTETDTLAS